MRLIDLAEQLELVTAKKPAELIFQSYLTTFGFRSYAFTYYSGHVKTSRELRYHHVSPALRAWHTHYLEQRYADVDRTLEENHHGILPLYWDVQIQLAQAKHKREQRIRLESIEFGIDKGLSLPVHGPQHDFATLTLHQRRGETCLKNYKTQQFTWLSATQLFYNTIRRVLNLDKIPASPYQLTRREEQCLALTAKSCRVEQIAKELKISERTVNFHIQNANRKLGTSNKYQASYKYFQSKS